MLFSQVLLPDTVEYSYTLKEKDKTNYLYAFAKGNKDTKEVSFDYLFTALNKAEFFNTDKILLEEHFGSQLSTTELFDIVPSWFINLSVNIK